MLIVFGGINEKNKWDWTETIKTEGGESERHREWLYDKEQF